MTLYNPVGDLQGSYLLEWLDILSLMSVIKAVNDPLMVVSNMQVLPLKIYRSLIDSTP